MPRIRAKTEAAPVIEPLAPYRRHQVAQLLGMPLAGVRAAIKSEGLRRSRRRGRDYILGEWLLEWIKAGEVVRPAVKATEHEAGERPGRSG